MELGCHTLRDFLSVRGMITSGTKSELVARAFTAVELKLPIIDSSEEQKRKLAEEYSKRLATYEISDPLMISDTERSKDVTKWPNIHAGCIFEYILRVRDFDTDYIGRYKDQKAYSYWDSGFVGQISTYDPTDRKDIKIVYGDVRASLTVTTTHHIWVLVRNDPVSILTCWCSCMAGSSQCCNHCIAVLYKIDYAARKGYLDPACTSMPCQWNQSSKKEIEPKRVKDISIRKRLKSKVDETD